MKLQSINIYTCCYSEPDIKNILRWEKKMGGSTCLMALAPTESMKLADVQSRMMEWTVHRGSMKTASSRSDSLCRSSSWPFLCSSATLLWDKTSWVTPCSSYWNQTKRKILHYGNSNKPQGTSGCHFCVFLDPAAESRGQKSPHSTERYTCESLSWRNNITAFQCHRGGKTSPIKPPEGSGTPCSCTSAWGTSFPVLPGFTHAPTWHTYSRMLHIYTVNKADCAYTQQATGQRTQTHLGTDLQWSAVAAVGLLLQFPSGFSNSL